MLKISKTNILSILVLPALIACGKDHFGNVKQQSQYTAPSLKTWSNSSCASSHYIKPKVDFLFLWDNSTSTYFINDETIKALGNTINLVSSRFDFRILMAPILTNQTSQLQVIVSDDPDDLSSGAKKLIIPPEQASGYLNNYPKVSGSSENGLERAVELIRYARNQKIFRSGASLNVVIMSNGDDNSWIKKGIPIAAHRDTYFNEKLHQLLCLRGKYNPPGGKRCHYKDASLNLQMMRFHSIVAHAKPGTSHCPHIASGKQNYMYKTMSRKLYQSAYVGGSSPNDQQSRTDQLIDSYDICRIGSFNRIFDGINASLKETLVAHKYNYWPVASVGAPSFNHGTIQVWKDNTLLQPSTTNGYRLFYSSTSIPTRYYPNSGEPFSGHLIALYGNAKVTYPECIKVKTESPKDYFGYYVLPLKPDPNSIVVKINGENIPQSPTNGWQLLKEGSAAKFFKSQNIKIRSDFKFCTGRIYCEGEPAINKTGYVIQFFGNSIYSNNDSVNIIYDPLGSP